VAGCATPTGSAGHAGATANLKLTFHLDHSAGADHGLREFTVDVWLLLAITVPMTLVGIYLGNRFFAELSDVKFRRLVSLTLIVPPKNHIRAYL
jgi:uncharacterized membrane protein YfcA